MFTFPTTMFGSSHSVVSSFSVLSANNQYILSNANAPASICGDPALTISLWINFTTFSGGSGSPISWGAQSSDACVLYPAFRGTGILSWEFGGSQGVWTATPLSTGTWYNLIYCKPPGAINQATIYYNGVLQTNAGGSGGTPAIATGNPIYIDQSVFLPCTAYIDDVRIYNRVLNQADVTAIYTGNNPTVNDPVVWYKLEEGTGTTVADSSGNGNNASFTIVPPTWSTNVPPPLQG